LEKTLLLEREGRGPQSLRKLTEPGKLLDMWADRHKLTAYDVHRLYRWSTDPDQLALDIGNAVELQGDSYAATLALGAMHRAPFLTESDQVALLVPKAMDAARLAAQRQLKPAEDGWNVLLLGTKNDAALMYRQKDDGLWIASDIQIYLDLKASSGRGKEQAEHLRRERLGF
jgi:hypothetical protein